MSALPSDVQRATRAARIVVRTDTAVRATFPAARDGVQSPDVGYFVNAADASTVLALKAALIGTARRRFKVDCAGEALADPATAIPSYALTCAELAVTGLPALLCQIEVDFEAETTTLEVLG
jgi:hypothetical protein